MVSRHDRGYWAGLVSQINLNLLDGSFMIDIDRVRCRIVACDPGVAHNGNPGAYFFILAGPFELERKGVVGAHLMPNLVHDIIDIEIISHGNPVSRRSNAASLLSVYTNTANTSRVSATAGSAKHVADIVIGLPDDVG